MIRVLAEVEKNTSSAADADKILMIITGFHAIEEKLRSLKKAENGQTAQIFYSKAGPRVKKILAAAQENSVKAEQVPETRLNQMVSSLDAALRDHRGIVLQLSGENSGSGSNIVLFDDWLKAVGSKKSSCTVLILDKITDPHNVGAILRSADQFGADLVIIPEHKSSSSIASNEVIARASAGASAWVSVAVVNNLVRAAEQLKQAGFWIYGADAGGESCIKFDFAQKAAIIMGSEGNGISDLLKKQCDAVVSIPTCGKIDSLNVSVAAGVLLYELFRRR